MVDRIAKGVHKVPGLHAVSALLGAVFGVLEAFVWMGRDNSVITYTFI